jgi:hypothetical protein
MILPYAVVAAAWLLVAVVAVASVAAILRRWSLVVRLSRGAAVAGACVLVALAAFVALVFAAPQSVVSVLPASADPSYKARILGELISELMNCGALALLGALAAAVLWAFASWRKRIHAA